VHLEGCNCHGPLITESIEVDSGLRVTNGRYFNNRMDEHQRAVGKENSTSSFAHGRRTQLEFNGFQDFTPSQQRKTPGQIGNHRNQESH